MDTAPRTASQHGVGGVPEICFYKNGKTMIRAVGTLPKSGIERRPKGPM